MKGIILCAGYATRLYPLTKDKPKPLLPVAGRPIIEFLIEDLEKIDGLEEVYIVTNDKFASTFEDWAKNCDTKIDFKVINDMTTDNDNRLGAIGDILYVVKKENLDDDTIIIAGDNIFDLSLPDFVSYSQSVAPAATIAAYDVKDVELAKKYGLLVLNDDKKVIEFQEKPKEPKTTLASLGLYYYPKQVVQLLQKYVDEGNNTDQPGNFVAWLHKESAVYGYAFDGSWFDIGDFKSLEKANEFFSK